MRTPTKDEYEFVGRTVTHKPTGARFSFLGDGTLNIRSAEPDGDAYDYEAVMKMAIAQFRKQRN